MYVYINSEPGLWTVGFYDPSGKFQPESDHKSEADAAGRVSKLNGSNAVANERELRRIADIARRQIEGAYTVQSDAHAALVLIQELALALVSE